MQAVGRRELENIGLPYHSSHKFRHGHVQYGLARSKNTADFKAVSLNELHSSMEINDQFYSNLNDSEVQKRTSNLNIQEQVLRMMKLNYLDNF